MAGPDSMNAGSWNVGPVGRYRTLLEHSAAIAVQPNGGDKLRCACQLLSDLLLIDGVMLVRLAEDGFPSVAKNGTKPISPDMMLRGHIRPFLKRLGITMKIGWHFFRHGFSNLLRETRVEIKTAQDLLRHANSRTTMDIYQQTVTEERRSAQALAFKSLLGEANLSTLQHPESEEKEEVGLETD